MNGNITKEGITAGLEAMKRIGLGGAQIFNVSDVPEGAVAFMSPQWLELMQHAAAEAGRLGLDLGFHNCAGWTSSGGPWITPEHAMQTVVSSEARISGPAHFEAALPQPRAEQGYYRDIAVLAFPTPRGYASGSDTFKRKAGFDGSDYLQPKPATIPAAACVPRDRIVDLTGRLSADGRLISRSPGVSCGISGGPSATCSARTISDTSASYAIRTDSSRRLNLMAETLNNSRPAPRPIW